MTFVYILLGAVLVQVLGALWYSNFLFGKKWQNLAGFSHVDMDMVPKEKQRIKMILSFIAALVFATFIFMVRGSAASLVSAFVGGFLLVLLLAGSVSFAAYVWEGRKLGLFWIHNVYMALAGGILLALYTLV